MRGGRCIAHRLWRFRRPQRRAGPGARVGDVPRPRGETRRSGRGRSRSGRQDPPLENSGRRISLSHEGARARPVGRRRKALRGRIGRHRQGRAHRQVRRVYRARTGAYRAAADLGHGPAPRGLPRPCIFLPAKKSRFRFSKSTESDGGSPWGWKAPPPKAQRRISIPTSGRASRRTSASTRSRPALKKAQVAKPRLETRSFLPNPGQPGLGSRPWTSPGPRAMLAFPIISREERHESGKKSEARWLGS